ncbi:MAG: UDP-glucose 4-epimerase GalE [Deltaproteobacteria bacterium RBG_13_52_11]|nr:MAG: UDP-glucose 4-epimerase GalE [Deltaproteobacteria bacterium RBG_13_52_11]
MNNCVLVTGGAGYIGSHVVKELRRQGYQPLVYDNLSAGHRWAIREDELIEGDLGNKRHVEEILRKEKPLAVIHCAGSIVVSESVERPEFYFRNNVINTFNLLEAMLACDVKSFIFSSSAAVYGKPHQVPIPEDHPLSPVNPYGESKVFVEKALRWYEEAHSLRYISLRYFNAAGADPEGELGEAHNPETHLIPLILAVAAGKRPFVEIYGTDYDTPDGTCIRDYIHVIDLAQAHILSLGALLNGTTSRVYNLGNQRGFSVREVVDCAHMVTGHSIPVRESSRRQGDPPVLVASSERIKKELGWKPHYGDLKTILETAWGWMKEGKRR